MQSRSPLALELDGAAAARLLAAASSRAGSNWWRLEALRSLYGAGGKDARPLGYDRGPDPENPDYAFLAVDATDSLGGGVKDAKRSVVLLAGGSPALISFDIVQTAAPSPPPRWQCRGSLSQTVLLPRPAGGSATAAPPQPVSEHLLLNVLAPASSAPGSPPADITTVDLAGARVGDWAVFFHRDTRSAQSAVSFLVDDAGITRCLVTGLAPGLWEVWCAGWLLHPLSLVHPEAGALLLDGAPGGYFLRRTG